MIGIVEPGDAPPSPGGGPCGGRCALSARVRGGEMCYNSNRRAAMPPAQRFPARQ
jgi:hypothetical protein